MDSFVFDGEEYKQDTFALMLVDVVKILDKLKPGILDGLARENYSFTSGGKIYITYDTEIINRSKEIRDGIFIESNMNQKFFMKFIASLFERFNIDKSRFYIFVKASPNKQD